MTKLHSFCPPSCDGFLSIYVFMCVSVQHINVQAFILCKYNIILCRFMRFINHWKNLAFYVCLYRLYFHHCYCPLLPHFQSLLKPHKSAPDFVVWFCSEQFDTWLKVHCKEVQKLAANSMLFEGFTIFKAVQFFWM